MPVLTVLKEVLMAIDRPVVEVKIISGFDLKEVTKKINEELKYHMEMYGKLGVTVVSGTCYYTQVMAKRG
jgi:hypothetical protein